MRHHIGQPERTANLDELAARNDDFASRRERGQDQQRGAGIVVDDCGGFRAGEFGEQGFDQFVPLDTFAGIAVHGQVHVTLQAGNHRVHDATGKDRAPQTGVQNDAGGVDGLAHARLDGLTKQFARLTQYDAVEFLHESAGIFVGQASSLSPYSFRQPAVR